VRIDELAAIRLADLEGLYHEEAARKREISRSTLGRILAEARDKVAEAIIKGKALRIENPIDEKGECLECFPFSMQGCSSLEPWHFSTCSGVHSSGFPFNSSGH